MPDRMSLDLQALQTNRLDVVILSHLLELRYHTRRDMGSRRIQCRPNGNLFRFLNPPVMATKSSFPDESPFPVQRNL